MERRGAAAEVTGEAGVGGPREAARAAAPRASRVYVSLVGDAPYALLEWPSTRPLPRVGARVSLRLLEPRMGMGAMWPGLRSVFAGDEVRGLRVISVEGSAAREYSNILHSGAPPKDARAVRLEIPAGSLRRAPRSAARGKGDGLWRAARAKKAPGGKGRGGALDAKVARALPLPDVARGPASIEFSGRSGAAAEAGRGWVVPVLALGAFLLICGFAAVWLHNRRRSLPAGEAAAAAAGRGEAGEE